MGRVAKSGGGKNRKKGDWIAIERGRAGIARVIDYSHGMDCAPTIGQVGSAAYRRLMKSRQRRS